MELRFLSFLLEKTERYRMNLAFEVDMKENKRNQREV